MKKYIDSYRRTIKFNSSARKPFDKNYLGFFILPLGKKIVKNNNNIWLGFYVKDFEIDDEMRLYCCVEIFSQRDINKIKNKLLKLKVPQYYKEKNKIYLYKPLISIIGDKKKEDHGKELDKFFDMIIKELQKQNIFDLLK